MEERGAAAFPGARGRIPNFVGASAAADRLATLDEWRRARVIKCIPDAPQRHVRLRALREGKVVYMAVPRLREARGFWELDPRRLRDLRAAASIGGAAKMGRAVDPRDLPQMDLIVAGPVAVARSGARPRLVPLPLHHSRLVHQRRTLDEGGDDVRVERGHRAPRSSARERLVRIPAGEAAQETAVDHRLDPRIRLFTELDDESALDPAVGGQADRSPHGAVDRVLGQERDGPQIVKLLIAADVEPVEVFLRTPAGLLLDGLPLLLRQAHFVDEVASRAREEGGDGVPIGGQNDGRSDVRQCWRRDRTGQENETDDHAASFRNQRSRMEIAAIST